MSSLSIESSPSLRYSRLLTYTLLPVLLATVSVLALTGSTFVYRNPLLLSVGNLLFLTVTSATVAFLAARSFLARSSPGILLLGCGAAVWAVGGALTSTVGGMNANAQITIFNTSACLAGLLHLAGAILSLRFEKPLGGAAVWLAFSYALSIAAVLLIATSTVSGLTPDFYVPGRGPTPLRQFVLGAAVAMFGLSGLIIFRRPASAFNAWYALALLLFAVGLFGVQVLLVYDSLQNWIGRFTQWLGGVSLVAAIVAALRESKLWGISLEAALSAAQHRTDEILEMINDGFVALDRQWRFTYVNRAAEELIGSRERLLGRSFSEAFPEAALRRLQHEYSSGLDAGKCMQFEENCPAPLNRWIEVRAHPVADGISILFRDVTERKRAEQALLAAQAELQAHAARLEATVAERTQRLQRTVEDLEHFSYAMAHDMRAPLRAISGYAEMLQEEITRRGPPELLKYLERIMRSAVRMDRLIAGSLNYGTAARITPALQIIDLEEFLPSLLDTYPHLRDKAEITMERPLPAVLGNDALLAQCFSNLLGNAIKFVAAGVQPRVRIRAERRGPMIRIWCDDNGIGIPASQQERLFQLFNRLTTEYDGSGIGLAIVRRLVTGMGGSVGVESEPGKGSSFWLELHPGDAADPMAPAPLQAGSDVSGEGWVRKTPPGETVGTGPAGVRAG